MTLNTDKTSSELTIQSGLMGATPSLTPMPDLQITSDLLIGLQSALPGRTEIVFVESNVGAIDTLLQGIGIGKEVYVIDAGQDGLQQMADILAGRSGIDAIHIVTHGKEGTVDLGASWLDETTIASHTSQLQTIGQSLSADGDVLLYGCNVGAGQQGAQLVDQLAIYTGADVAASSDLTGSATLGGDWDLEIQSGSIESPLLVDAAQADFYAGVLSLSNQIVSFNNLGNFTNDGGNSSNQDVTYTVQPGYVLKIDGATDGVKKSTVSPGYVEIVASNGTESAVTFSFTGGQVFTISTLNVYSLASQTLYFTGYINNNTQVGSTQSVSVGNTPSQINLSGFSDITKLVMTSSSSIQPLDLDSLYFLNIHAAPSVTSVTSSTSNGTYTVGDVISIQVNFSEAVNVTGTPLLTLETGTTDRVVGYSGGSGTSALTFSYTVQAGDTSADLDYFSTGALALNGGTIRDAAGNNATLTLAAPGTANSLGANKAIVIDTAPTITSATYNASTGVLTVTGTNLAATAGATNDIDVSKLTLTGQGSNTYTLTSSNVEISSSTSFSITLNSTDQINVNGLLNKNGTSSVYGTTYNLAGAAGWNVAASSASDTTGNGVTVTNVTNPTITSATFDAATGVLNVSGANLVKQVGANNDITVSTLSITGEGGNPYTLTSSSVEIISDSSFSVTLNVADLAYITQILNKNGTSSTGGTTYSLAAADDWNTVIANTDISDGTNAITVSNVVVPSITSATYDGNTGVLVVTGTGFTHVSGANNDIVANKFTLTGQGGATYTLTDTANVDTTSGTSFTLTLSATDKAAVNLLLNNNGTSSVGATTYNLAAAEDWAAGTDSAVIVADLTSNGITVSNAVDSTPPAAPSAPDMSSGSDSGSSSTDNITNDTTPSFSGTAEANSTLTLYDTDGTTVLATTTTDGSGNWSLTSSTLSTGAHTLTTKATDASSNTSSASTALTVSIDTSAPLAPSEPDMTAGSDTGGSSTDNVTNNTTPIFTGTSEANATVTLYDTDGTTQLASTTADGSGNWSATSSTLSAGNHTLTTKATDVAGNTSSASSGLLISVETTVPTVTSINRAGSALVNGSTTSVDYTVTFAEGVSGVDTSDFTLTPTGTASGSINSVTQVSASIYTVTVNALSGDGTMRLDLKNSGTGITDTAGNAIAAGYTAGQTYTLDSVVPAVTSVSVPANSTYIAGQNLDFTVNFGEAVTVNTTGGTPYMSLTLDTGGNVQAAYVSGSGSTALVFRYTVLSGEEDLNGVGVGSTIIANGGTLQDAAGNNAVLTLNSVGSTLAVLVDAVVPTTTVVTAALSADTGVSATDFITKTAAQTISGTLSANLVTDETVEISLDNGATWSTATSTVGLNTWTRGGVTLAGSDTLKVRVADASGGGTAYSHAYTLDTTSPNAPSTPDLAAGSDSGTSSTDDITNDTTPTLTGTAEANSTVTLYDTDGTTVLGTTTADGGGNWSLTSSALTNGAHTLTTKATDVAGNVSSASSGLTVTIDTTAPAAPSAPDMTNGTDSGASNSDNITSDTTPTFIGTSVASATVTLYDTDGTTVLGTTTADVGGNWTMTSSTLTDGAHTLTTKASDTAGNSSAASPSLSITIDSTAPTLQSSTPADNATAVAVASNIVLNFAESVSAVGGKSVSLYKTTGNVLVESIAVNDVAKVTIAAGTVTINPTADFTETTDYYVLVDNGAFVDSAGNVYGGITSTTDLGFTTLTTPPPAPEPVDTAPSLSVSTPTDNALDVPVDANIVLTFNEFIRAGIGNITISNVSNARSVADTRVISINDPQVSIEENRLTLNLTQDLQPQSTYHVTIEDGAITDLSGMAFPGISNATTLNFLTAADHTEGPDPEPNPNPEPEPEPQPEPEPLPTPAPYSRFTDTDHDGFPDALEVLNGLTVGIKDNDVIANNDLFVMQLYRDILYREADADGLIFWTQVLEQNLISRELVAEAFVNSHEFQDVVGSVARLYLGTFDRMPDQAGLNYWVETLRAGASLSDIGDAFVASEEFSNLYGALDGAGFPAPLYNNILHREADLPGMQYWQTQLAAGVSKGQVLSLFTNSPEFEASSLPAITSTLTSLGILGALPDQPTLNTLIQDIEAGTPLLDIIGTMLSSVDYHDRFL